VGQSVTPYRRPLPLLWWVRTPAYVRFVLRELTSVFIAAYLVLFLILLARIGAGPEAYAAYRNWLGAPALLGFHLVALAAAVYHSITWLSLTPLAVVVRLRGRRVPPAAIIAANLAVWLLLSILVAWLILRR
jgi:fumarate reductase subunit C